jgi:hypothetical protein
MSGLEKYYARILQFLDFCPKFELIYFPVFPSLPVSNAKSFRKSENDHHTILSPQEKCFFL